MTTNKPRRAVAVAPSIETARARQVRWKQELSVVKPFDSDLDAEDWPIFELREAIVLSKDGTRVENALDIINKGPFLIRGNLIIDDVLQEQYLVKKSEQSTPIEIRNSATYSIGESPDGQPVIWVSGLGGWYEVNPCSAYLPVYRRMCCAVTLYYAMVDIHSEFVSNRRSKKAKLVRRPEELPNIFFQYALRVGDGSTFESVMERCAEHSQFLMYQFEREDSSALNWRTTAFYAWLGSDSSTQRRQIGMQSSDVQSTNTAREASNLKRSPSIMEIDPSEFASRSRQSKTEAAHGEATSSHNNSRTRDRSSRRRVIESSKSPPLSVPEFRTGTKPSSKLVPHPRVTNSPSTAATRHSPRIADADTRDTSSSEVSEGTLHRTQTSLPNSRRQNQNSAVTITAHIAISDSSDELSSKPTTAHSLTSYTTTSKNPSAKRKIASGAGNPPSSSSPSSPSSAPSKNKRTNQNSVLNNRQTILNSEQPLPQSVEDSASFSRQFSSVLAALEEAYENFNKSKHGLKVSTILNRFYFQYKFPCYKDETPGSHKIPVMEVFHYNSADLLRHLDISKYNNHEFNKWLKELSRMPFQPVALKMSDFPYEIIDRSVRKHLAIAETMEATLPQTSEPAQRPKGVKMPSRSKRSTLRPMKSAPEGFPHKRRKIVVDSSDMEEGSQVVNDSEEGGEVDDGGLSDNTDSELNEDMEDAEPSALSLSPESVSEPDVEPISFQIHAERLPDMQHNGLDDAWACAFEACDFVIRGDDKNCNEQVESHLKSHEQQGARVELAYAESRGQMPITHLLDKIKRIGERTGSDQATALHENTSLNPTAPDMPRAPTGFVLPIKRKLIV